MKEGRLAIVGAGSSGLVTLKNALDRLPGWDIICYEKGDDAIGCWGNPYPGFVSTSTKFTTQFTSHRKWDCRVDPADRESREDFFKGDEYGRYLTGFSEEHGLARHIRKNATVEMIEKDVKGWRLWIDGEAEVFDRLIICTGLAEKPKVIDSPVPSLRSLDEPPHQQTIVVIGGGESAADIAHRLAEPSLGNRVYLSLKSGIRVSPRYHPIRGVPSDFLRNRLMLSIHQRLRNAIGQKFVEARIRHREKFERFFGSRAGSSDVSASVTAKRKSWDAKLTAGAKDQLFNVFHTKSDDFLDDVAADRITIIGPPCDDGYRSFRGFDDSSVHTIEADAIYPMIGYSSGLSEISDGEVLIRDFHLGCLHVRHDDLFLVGFARPIIGNVPTISEMQAKLVTGIIAGCYERPTEIDVKQAEEREQLARDFPQLNTDSLLPVEMFPYCDLLARMMGSYPSLGKVGSLGRWVKIMLSPASTLHYVDDDFDPEEIDSQIVHSPPVITVLLLLIKLLDLPYRALRREG